jgi:hypothetical protein
MGVDRLQLFVELLNDSEGVEALRVLEEGRHGVAQQGRIEDLVCTLILAGSGNVLLEQRLVGVLQFLGHCLHDVVEVGITLVLRIESVG